MTSLTDSVKDLEFYIRVIEHALGIKLSPEQLRILLYQHHTQTIVDACAGSGKTTLYLIDALLQIVSHRCKPRSILGVTFSKKAQLSMLHKYWHFIDLLRKQGVMVKGQPIFMTFHAMFYRLLININNDRDIRVLASWKQIQYQLIRYISDQSQVRSKFEILNDIFDLRSSVINDGISYDGLHTNNPNINTWKQFKLLLLRDASVHYMTRNDAFYIDYRNVIKHYHKIKQNHHWIDFNDMQTHLYQTLIKHPDKQKKLRRELSYLKYVFIDEFQDISKSQWRLIKLIIPKEAWHHLSVIGDDDQAIYHFRGGDPNIMLNFNRYVPTAKIFKLSTNYRTAGNVLKAVRPLIKANHYRYRKKLLTNKPGDGSLSEFISDDKSVDSGRMLFNDLSKKVKDPRIPNDQIAILVRYNSDRMFAIDWLANHSHFIATSRKTNILQNNYIYKIFYGILIGIIKNQLKPLYVNATRIGFNKYQRHMSNVIGLKHIRKLSQYLRLSREYDRKNHIFHSFIGSQDLLMSRAFYEYRKKYNQANPNLELWNNVDNLTKAYFKFMDTKNNYISKALVNSIKRHFKDGAGNCSNMTKFLKSEKDKQHILNDKSLAKYYTKHPVTILSLHQSKGLQFRYVYLYGLSNRDVKPYMVLENRYFSPSSSRQHFLKHILQMNPVILKHIDDHFHYKNPFEDFNHDVVRWLARLVNLPRNRKKNTQILTQKNLELLIHGRITNTDYDGFIIQAAFDTLYNQTIRNSLKVEEERRLIYVGITRSEDEACINMGKSSNPLLKELSVPNSHVCVKVPHTDGYTVLSSILMPPRIYEKIANMIGNN